MRLSNISYGGEFMKDCTNKIDNYLKEMERQYKQLDDCFCNFVLIDERLKNDASLNTEEKMRLSNLKYNLKNKLIYKIVSQVMNPSWD